MAKKLVSLTLSHLDILFGREEQLLDVLEERREGKFGLKSWLFGHVGCTRSSFSRSSGNW